MYPIPSSGFPSRERIQQEVKSAEIVEAEELLAAYAEAKALADEHDIAALSVRILSCETEGRHWDLVAAEKIRRQRDKADDDVFQAAQLDLAEIRRRAQQINLDILARTLASLENEIAATAIATEERLIAAGLELFTDVPTAGVRLIAPWSAPAGFERRWQLHSDTTLTMIRSRRDCVQWKITCLSKIPSGITETNAEVGVHSLPRRFQWVEGTDLMGALRPQAPHRSPRQAFGGNLG